MLPNAHALSSPDDAYAEAVHLGEIADNLGGNGQFDESIEYYKKAEKIFNDSGYETNVAVAKMSIGIYYGRKGEYDTALLYLTDARKIHHKYNDLPREIAAIGNSGKIYLLKGELDKAFALFNEAYNLSHAIGDKHGEGLGLANIGAYYREKEDYTLALEYHQKALDIFTNINDSYNIGTQSLLIAFAQSRIGNSLNAELYAEQAKTIFESLNYTAGLKQASLVSGDIFYGKANYYMSIDDFQKSIENFYLAEGELKKVIDMPQAKFSYAYTLMKEGDLYSRNESHDKAIDKFNSALNALHELSIDNDGDKQPLSDVENLLLAKINFEKGIKEANSFNFADASKYFGSSETMFKQVLNASSMSDKKKLIGGYVFYSSSKKNYFLFRTTANEGYRTLSQDELRNARDLFEDAGFHDLAREAVKEKMINFPESSIPYKDDVLLFKGLGFQKIQFNSTMLTPDIGYITFNYGYIFEVPYDGLPQVKFCCEEFCSEWVKIIDNELSEAKIKISSTRPMKIDCDIDIYTENRPEIAIGKIEDLYYPTFKVEPKIQGNTIFFEISDDHPYKKVNITIEKPFWGKVKDSLELPSSIFSIVGISILSFLVFLYGQRDKVKNFVKNNYNRVKECINVSKKKDS